jgi:hypothetical protein
MSLTHYFVSYFLFSCILFFSFLRTFSNLPQPSRRAPTHSLPVIDVPATGHPRRRPPSSAATDDLATGSQRPRRPSTLPPDHQGEIREISGHRRPATKGEDLRPSTHLLRRLLLLGATCLLLPAARAAEHHDAPGSRAPPRRSPGGPEPLVAVAALSTSALPSRMRAP